VEREWRMRGGERMENKRWRDNVRFLEVSQSLSAPSFHKRNIEIKTSELLTLIHEKRTAEF